MYNNILHPNVWNIANSTATNKSQPQQQPASLISNASTPRQISIKMTEISVIPETNTKRRLVRRFLIFLLCCFCVVGAAVVIAIVISLLKSQDSDATMTTIANATASTTVSTIINTTVSTTVSTTASTTISTTVSTTVSTTASTTVPVTCATGLSQTSSGTCVNTQIDFNNCGSVGYVCSSNYTSCSTGLCSSTPAVALSGAIPVPGFGGSISVDDQTVTVVFPLSLTLYNYSSNSITVSSNGVLCLGSCSAAYSNGALPDSQFAGPTVFGFWDDLYITSGSSQTIYYAVSGTAPNRITTFEFYESHYGGPTQYYHFQIIFHENLPNIVECLYLETYDGGASATIGVQQSGSGPSMTYLLNQAVLTYNTTVIFDTSAGTYSG
ncbi:unnamed protein product [Adineta steineri]|uniref:Uncharacterized protein n=1 Tax=Adineta steineri TaxID=433720 RepID=A0A818VA62_9BILA|nr:unnamed protein product [Adineta steineri]CAF3704014.1 unnamed protein product [Adineta steineri]